jgi:hypothetical protein
MIDVDCDDHDIHHAMRRATRIRWKNSRTVPYVAHDSDDCAAGLVTDPGIDHIKRGPCAGASLSAICRLTDFDRDRPSPGDDITHAAFDEPDRER